MLCNLKSPHDDLYSAQSVCRKKFFFVDEQTAAEIYGRTSFEHRVAYMTYDPSWNNVQIVTWIRLGQTEKLPGGS